MNLQERLAFFRAKAEQESDYDLDVLEQNIARAKGECNITTMMDLKTEILKELDDYAFASWLEENAFLGDLLDNYSYVNGQLLYNGVVVAQDGEPIVETENA